MKRFTRELLFLIVISLLLQWLVPTYIYPLIGLPSNGPVPIRTIVLVVVISTYLKHSGEKWSQFGLSWPFKWWWLIVAVVGLFACKLFIIQPTQDLIRSGLDLPRSDHRFFAHIEGNSLALTIWLLIAWLSGGFGEEMIFRGYLIGRISPLFHNETVGFAIAITFQAVIFGLGHAYAGWGTALMSMTNAFLLGLFLILVKRSIWPLIIVHGIWDTLGVLNFYLEGTQ
ncbi:MAG: type II CAAX endopeptidase family protein [Cytophagales bacterium]|nr:type II CAAX endopeptidase family protein [Cytophagales bacterium]